MALNPIGVAVPFFFGLMMLELGIAYKKGRNVYRFNDAFSDLGCGLGEQAIGVFGKAAMLGVYAAIEGQVGLFEFKTNAAWTWLFGMVVVDFFYYWYHRFSHRVNFAWLTHGVHHQSEDYNLAVALRQPWFTQAYDWLFYVPLALLGVPPIVFITCYSLNLLYQFWIHTQLIDSMGAFERVFNTPSHHRVHHGTNPEYIDKNYAGILIIWDRFFGTFEQEHATPVYGTLKPLRRWNPLWANVGPWVLLARQATEISRWRDKLWLWLAPPEWTPGDSQEPPPPFPAEGRGYNADVPRSLHVYILGHFVPVSLGTTVILLFKETLPGMPVAIGLGLMMWTVVGWGVLFDQGRWALPLELARLLALSVAAGLAAMAWGGAWLGALFAIPLAMGSAWWLLRRKVEFGLAA